MLQSGRPQISVSAPGVCCNQGPCWFFLRIKGANMCWGLSTLHIQLDDTVGGRSHTEG